MALEVEKINQFLSELFDIINSSDIIIIPRPKNTEFLGKFNVSYKDAKSLILSLSCKDYSSGPDMDDNGSGYIWVFGKEMLGKLTYIKLKIDFINGRKIAKCISFHSADWNMKFPFKEVS